MDYPIHMETILPIKTKPETRKCMLEKDLKECHEHTLSSSTMINNDKKAKPKLIEATSTILTYQHRHP